MKQLRFHRIAARTNSERPYLFDSTLAPQDGEMDPMIAWCREQFGPETDDADGIWNWDSWGLFEFKSIADATAFKLRWM